MFHFRFVCSLWLLRGQPLDEFFELRQPIADFLVLLAQFLILGLQGFDLALVALDHLNSVKKINLTTFYPLAHGTSIRGRVIHWFHVECTLPSK